MAETLDGRQVETEWGGHCCGDCCVWGGEVLGDGQFEQHCFSGRGRGADDEVVSTGHDEWQTGLLDVIEVRKVKYPT